MRYPMESITPTTIPVACFCKSTRVDNIFRIASSSRITGPCHAPVQFAAANSKIKTTQRDIGRNIRWRRAWLLSDADVFRLGEKPKRFFAAFAADAALFHAAERDAQVAHEPAIYPNRARIDSLGDAMGATEVLRPD